MLMRTPPVLGLGRFGSDVDGVFHEVAVREH